MLSLGVKEVKGSSGKQRGKLAFWIVRFVFLGITAGLIAFGVVWWRERPLAEAEAALIQGDAKYADFLLSKFLDRHPHHQRAMALQARIKVALGNPDAALALFDEVGGATAEDLHAWARALIMREEWSLALPLLERVVQLEPEHADALYELTACRVRLGLFEEALDSARRLARLPGHEARGHMFVGAILCDVSREAEAEAAYQKALHYDPTAKSLEGNAAEFFLQYGQLLLRRGKPEESLEPLKRSAAIREAPEVLLELGNAAMQLQRLEHAKAAWRRAVELDPRHVPSREALAGAALQESQPQQALDWLAPLPEEEATLESAFLRQRAYTMLGSEKEALRWQETAAALRKKQEFEAEVASLLLDAPQSFWARVVRAHRFAEQGNWRQAELLANQLLQEAPADPFIIELSSAIHRRRELPSLESLPIVHH